LDTGPSGNGDEHYVSIAFERSVAGVGLGQDSLPEECRAYAEGWRNRVDVVRPEGSPGGVHAVQDDPRDRPPQNAWVLFGDEKSFPTKTELAQWQARGSAGIFECEWTVSKQADVGDLVLIYFVSKRKAVHFVARVASRAFCSREVSVNAETRVAKEQWWCFLTPPIEIEPIPYSVLRDLAGGYLTLRGRSGRYLRPEVVGGLPVVAQRVQNAGELERVFQAPTGRADLPPARDITAASWRSIAAGALDLESQVEEYLVEPLLRMCLGASRGMSWEKSFRVGSKVADYAVLKDGSPTCVVEVKLAVRESPDGVWENSKDFQQLRGYADSLECPGVLIDANRIYLIDGRASAPHRVVVRSETTDRDFAEIKDHIHGP